MQKAATVLGGSLLITGATIGVGMLAIPVFTAPGGFLPSLALYSICWLCMLCTGLLLTEACLWMPQGANIITIARTLLGPYGKAICWVTYLLLFFSLMIAHISGGGELIAEILNQSVPPWVSIFIYVLLFAPFVYLGTLSVDRANGVLVLGLLLSYLIFTLLSIGFIDINLLKHVNWSKSWIALPILFTAFTYQMIIPTLVNYMDRNIKKIRLSIYIGTAIPFIVYVFWEFVLLGIIPAEGPNSLQQAAKTGHMAIHPLKALTGYSHIISIEGHRMIFFAGKLFAFFAITTSFITLSLAFVDFLADGFKWEKTQQKKQLLCVLVFLPPTIIAMLFPSIFLKAVSYAGGFFCAILFGVFPILMVWSGRHFHHYPDETKQLFGGKYFLSLLMVFVLFEISINVFTTFVKG